MYLNIDKLFACLLRDLCIDNVSRDYLLRRLNAEGVKFLTVTLPGLWKSTLISMERGFFVYEENTSFARKRKLPLVMNGLFRRIFDARGYLLADPCEKALLAIRQVCEYWYKCAFTFSEDQLDSATKSFLSVEDTMKNSKGSISESFVDECRKSFETYYKPLVNAKLEDVLELHRPSNGPGSVHVGGIFADMTVPELKLSTSALVGTCRVDQKPFAGFFKAYPASSERITHVDEWKLSEVMFVPKDSRGPRVISKEPLYLLKMQMSFLKWSTEALERITNYRINFKDQSKNRALALQGSIDRLTSTADLKEASDRIRYSVARTIYGNSPVFYYFLTKGRSTHSVLRTKKSVKTVRLTKLSGMGSGLTFPILALTIHIAVCTRIAKRYGLPYKEVMDLVYVYGDDLIVPTKYYDCVQSALEGVGLALNASKSFSKGPFRESCGGDYLNGKEVVPLRLKLASCKLPTTKAVDHFDMVVRVVKTTTSSWVVEKQPVLVKTWAVSTVQGKTVISSAHRISSSKQIVLKTSEKPCKRIVTLPKRSFRLNLSSPMAIVALERHARLLVQRGHFQTSEFIYTYLESILGKLPLVGGSVSYIGRYSQSTYEVVTQSLAGVVVYTTKAVTSSIQTEPCPYRYLGTKLTPPLESAPSSKAQAFAFANMVHGLGFPNEEIQIAPPGLELGQYNERYALNIVRRKEVEAWHLTNAL
uniref:RNA-directed RNA polymerase n=1 Tax=Sanxia levi-like virus 1 TaxID=1923359 RepID=A0A1L3KIL6_9VIRU|nr:hypothetical protein [Sanxia levi-like virus 1]